MSSAAHVIPIRRKKEGKTDKAMSEMGAIGMSMHGNIKGT